MEDSTLEPPRDSDRSDSVRPQRAVTRSRRSSSGSKSSRGPLRVFYFSLASLWGFVSGTAAMLGGLSGSDQALRLQPFLVTLLGAGGALALLGGYVTASAYRGATRRTRRRRH